MTVEDALRFLARSGKLAAGDFQVTDAVKRGKARVVVIDESVSDSTKEHWLAACRAKDIELVIYADIGRVTGKDGKKIFAALNTELADALIKAYKEGNYERTAE